MAVCDYSKTVGTTPLSPDDHIPLLQVKYSNEILEEKFNTFAGINWFNPEVKPLELTGDLKVGQSLIVRYKNPESPFDMVNVSDVTYKHDQTCPPQMDLDCTEGCISSVPSWRNKEIRFDKLYRIGASWCVETERLTYESLDERFRESVEANNMVQGVFAWNAFMCQALTAAKAQQTLIPTDKACFANHYIEAGSAVANGYEVLSQVLNYMKVVFGMQEYGIFAHRYFESDMVAPGATIYTGFGAASTANANAGATTVNQELVQGGWKPMGVLGGKLFGETIYIAPDSIWFYNPTIDKKTGGIAPSNAGNNSFNPFLSTNGEKYYVVIASRRCFLSGVVPLMEATRFPATCSDKKESLQASFLGYDDLLFPKEVFIIAFDVECPESLAGE